jgi:predicted nucleic acid-binding protein
MPATGSPEYSSTNLPDTAYLDTNVILRYLTQDNPDQSQRARKLFEQAERGEITLITTEAVVAETVYVLSSKALYNLPRADIRRHVGNILSIKGLKILHKASYLRALEIYASTNLDFVDALILAHMERTKVKTLISFEKSFDKVSEITRQEPQ